MLILTTVNDCLGTMGELPLTSLLDPHPLSAAAVSILDTVNREFQAKGWWFNREQTTLTPSVPDGFLNLPADAISVRTLDRKHVQRYRKLYNTDGGTYVFTAPQDIELVRLVPFEESPELFGAYVAAETVLRFQKRYDGDSTKTRQLADERLAARIGCNSEETRQVHANLIEGNQRLSYIKSSTRSVRGRMF